MSDYNIDELLQVCTNDFLSAKHTAFVAPKQSLDPRYGGPVLVDKAQNPSRKRQSSLAYQPGKSKR